MRYLPFVAAGMATLMISGCVLTSPLPPANAPATPAAPAAPAQPAVPSNVLDAASREVARNTINSEIQKRYPGLNVAPISDCVVNNASTDELLSIAKTAAGGGTSAATTVAGIVSRPATGQCITKAVQTA